MPQVELYIQDRLCDLKGDENIEVDYAIFDISKIGSRGGARSYEFELPKTNTNKSNLENPEAVNNLSARPYQKLKARIFVDGVDVLIRFAEIISAKDVYNVRVYGGNSDLFSLLKEKKCSELDLARFTHFWTLLNILAAVGNNSFTGDGYIYPIIDWHNDNLAEGNAYINNDNKTVRADYMLPCAFYNTILEQIFTDIAYSLVNEIEDDTTSVVISPSVNTAAVISDTKYAGKFSLSTDLSVQALVAQIDYSSLIGSFSVGQTVTDLTNGSTGLILTDNGSLMTIGDIVLQGSGFVAGHSIFTSTGQADIDSVTTVTNNDEVTYTPDTEDEYDGDYYQLPYGTGITLTFEDNFPIVLHIHFAVINNSTQPANVTVRLNIGGTDYFLAQIFASVGITIYDNTITDGDVIGGNTFTIPPEGGDLSINLQVVQGGDVTIDTSSFIEVESGFEGTFSTHLLYGARIDLASILPDIKQSELLLAYLQMFGLLPLVNEITTTVTLIEFDKILANISQAYDWSDLIDEIEDHEVRFIMENYARNNYFKYKEDGEENKPFGTDGAIVIDNANLELEKDVVELPFAASNDVTRLEGNLVNVIGAFENGEWANDKVPRVLVVEYKSATDMGGTVDLTDGTDTGTLSGVIPTTYFIKDGSTFNLGFGDNLLTIYYELLSSILNRVKIVTVQVRLSPAIISQLDFSRPVFIQKFEAYFYISTIKAFSYTESKSTLVELVKLNING